MSTEDRAKRMGWVSEENFKGDKDRWIGRINFLKEAKTNYQ